MNKKGEYGVYFIFNGFLYILYQDDQNEIYEVIFMMMNLNQE